MTDNKPIIKPERPPVNLDCIRKQIAGITTVLKEQVWDKKKPTPSA